MLKYDCEYSCANDMVSVIVEKTLEEITGEVSFEENTSLVDCDGDEICNLEDFIEVFWDKAVEKILNVVETQ